MKTKSKIILGSCSCLVILVGTVSGLGVWGYQKIKQEIKNNQQNPEAVSHPFKEGFKSSQDKNK